MNKPVLFLAMVISLALVCPGWAQPVPGGGGHLREGQLYNPQTVTTLTGQVEKLGGLARHGWRRWTGLAIPGRGPQD
jgi:hypothetical protein